MIALLYLGDAFGKELGEFVEHRGVQHERPFRRNISRSRHIIRWRGGVVALTTGMSAIVVLPGVFLYVHRAAVVMNTTAERVAVGTLISALDTRLTSGVALALVWNGDEKVE